MKLTHLKTNHVVNPLGFAIEKPTFSWIVEDTTDKVQTAAQILISRDSGFEQVFFDSGKVDGSEIDSLAYRPPVHLTPRTRYFWKVRVWGENENAESGTAWFETAKMHEDWQAAWITPDFEDNNKHPILFHSFELPAKAIAARAYICGLGLYHLELNGNKVGDEYFTPYCNAYDQWIQYQTFDITDQLTTGVNMISVMLGNGWYKGRYGVSGGTNSYYGDRFALLCEIHITLENGNELTIVTDPSWQAQPSPVIASDIFDGETYDARIKKVIPTGNAVGVKSIDIDMSLLEARRSLPTRIMQEIKPIALIQTPAGETVLDMGQNMTGWLRFKTSAPSGTRIHLQFGEVLQEGNFFRDNLRTSKAEHIYIANGAEALVEPYFTFFGFRYVKITGWVGEIHLDDFTGCIVYSQMDTIGEIETSNEKVNKLFQNAMWSQRDNFLDIPSDCPQRDERLGWTGDIQVFSGSACFNMDSSAFLSKFAYDLGKEQRKLGGMVPHIVPMVNQNKSSSAAWGDVATILPWNLYEFYGDIDILEQQFESMRAWVDYIKDIDDSSGGRRLWTEGIHFGDWLSQDTPLYDDPRRGGTPHDFIASAFYCYSAGLVAKAAKVLGKTQDADTYRRLSEDIKAAIQDEYFTATGCLAIQTQTAYLLALYMDLVADGHRKCVENDLIEQLKHDHNHLSTGFVGTPYLCRVLSNIGANDLAYKLLLNEDHPSWLYAINLGATTIWERWALLDPDGVINETDLRSHSFNHYAYGSIVEWMYRDMCGLNPSMENGVMGFRHARIAPKPDKSLQWARARYRSAAGLYESGWYIDETGYLTIEITIPYNSSATVVLPNVSCAKEILINDQKLSPIKQVEDCIEFTLEAGRHKFEYRFQ
ncbi:MAG: alfa-L-rhamnosidase RamA [Anaerolineaceae bacterium]|nr:alfa-L-rhamnosidase RamA [Anaerolineaceae bacterium]